MQTLFHFNDCINSSLHCPLTYHPQKHHPAILLPTEKLPRPLDHSRRVSCPHRQEDSVRNLPASNQRETLLPLHQFDGVRHKQHVFYQVRQTNLNRLKTPNDPLTVSPLTYFSFCCTALISRCLTTNHLFLG